MFIDMARGPRVTIPNIIYHVVNRGNNRQTLFKDEEDHRKYIELLERYKEKYGFRLYSYVLMSNHIHLLIAAGNEGSISKIMQGMTLAHTRYYNIKYKASGHVWQGRFKSPIVGEDSYLLEVSRYIELNPVRAKIVEKPEDYPWSSYAFHAFGKKDPLVDEHLFYETLGKTPEERQLNQRNRRLRTWLRVGELSAKNRGNHKDAANKGQTWKAKEKRGITWRH